MSQVYREGHCIAEVTKFDFYVTTSRDGRDFRKFGLVMRIVEEGHPDQGRSITFESLVDSEGAKKRVMTALKNIGYVVPAKGDANPMLQHDRLVGRKCRPKISCRDGKYWEASFVDPYDDNRSERPVEWKKPLSEEAKADFMESFNAYARSTLDQSSEEPAPQTQRQAQARQPAAPARAAAPAARPAAAPAAASRQAAPQRQPKRENPDLGDAPMGGDDEIPF